MVFGNYWSSFLLIHMWYSFAIELWIDHADLGTWYSNSSNELVGSAWPSAKRVSSSPGSRNAAQISSLLVAANQAKLNPSNIVNLKLCSDSLVHQVPRRFDLAWPYFGGHFSTSKQASHSSSFSSVCDLMARAWFSSASHLIFRTSWRRRRQRWEIEFAWLDLSNWLNLVSEFSHIYGLRRSIQALAVTPSTSLAYGKPIR